MKQLYQGFQHQPEENLMAFAHMQRQALGQGFWAVLTEFQILHSSRTISYLCCQIQG